MCDITESNTRLISFFKDHHLFEHAFDKGISEATSRIAKNINNYDKSASKSDKLRFSKILWIVATSPIRVLYCLSLEVISVVFFYVFFAKNAARSLSFRAGLQESRVMMVFRNYVFHRRKRVLVDAINGLSPDASMVYKEKSFNSNECDKNLVRWVTCKADENKPGGVGLHASHLWGQCAGMSDWFALLLLKFNQPNDPPGKLHENTQHHESQIVEKLDEKSFSVAPQQGNHPNKQAFSEGLLKSVAREFRDGANRYSAILQMAQFGKKKEHNSYETVFLNRKYFFYPTSISLKGVSNQVLSHLSPGVYGVEKFRSFAGLRMGHRMNVLVTEEKKIYLFDPNYGLIAGSASEIAKHIGVDGELFFSKISLKGTHSEPDVTQIQNRSARMLRLI